MLALKQAISLPSLKMLGWSPINEPYLKAWYKYKTGITVSGVVPSIDGKISEWYDSSNNGHVMQQLTVSEQPTITVATGAITFASAFDENLQTSLQIELTGEFTIGIRFYPTQFSNTVMGDNTTTNEFMKITGTKNLRIKNSSDLVNLGAATGFADDYLVITRSSIDAMVLWQNGVITDTGDVLTGTCLIDAIGIRAVDQNGFDGEIKEIMIFDTIDTQLTTDVNHRLSLLYI